MAVVKTYLGAIKPVGEKILLRYSADTVAADTPTAEYDFLINADYYITALSVTKVRSALPAAAAGVALGVTVSSVDSTGVATPVTQAVYKSITATPDGLVGSKAIAGLPNVTPAGITVAVGAIVSPLAYASATSFNGASAVASTVAVAGTTNAQQRIRVTISWAGAAVNNLNPSCFIEIRVAKYAPLTTQGVVGATSVGIQTEEVLIPPTA